MNKPDYVFVNHVSNVTGFITDIKAINNIVDEFTPIKILDTAQSMGLIPIEISEIGYDILVFAGHKTLYGPFGIAGYISNKKNEINPTIFGGDGSQSLNDERWESLEVGSPNINAVMGLNASLKWIKKIGVSNIFKHKIELTKNLIKGLEDIHEVSVIKHDDINKQIGIVSLIHEDFDPDVLSEILDQEFDIATRSGYHCAPYIHKLLKTEITKGTLRISLGYFTSIEEIKKVNEIIKGI